MERVGSARWRKHSDKIFCHVKDFRLDFHNPRITTSEGYRTIHRDSGVTDYMWARYKNTDMRWCYYRDRYTGWYPPSESIYPRSVVMYNQELAGDIKGTCMQYSVPDVLSIRLPTIQDILTHHG